MGKRFVATLALVVVLAVTLLGCGLFGGDVAEVPPMTPTKTLRPLFTSTFTPSPSPPPADTAPPTATEVPASDTPPPTNTPLPTDTATVESAPTEALPSETPRPPTEAAPSDTPRPRPTDTPAPPTNTPVPQVDFVIKEIIPFVDGSILASGFHNIYFTVVDAQGQPLNNIVLQDSNSQPPIEVTTGEKGPGKAEFTMVYADYYFRVAGDTNGRAYTSEITHRLSMIPGHYHWPDMIAAGICSNEAECQALGSVHFSYRITFQRTW